MSDLKRYFALVHKHPQMFVNPPGSEITVLLDESEMRAAEALMSQYYESQGLPTEWAEIGVAYQDEYLLILRDAVRFSTGRLGTYIRLVDDDGAQGVIILPIYQGQILLTRHFRHATRTWHIEIPRGFGMKGFSNLENAHRELEEETGAKIAQMFSLGQAYPNTGGTSECNEFFFAEISSYGTFDAEEGISELFLVSLVEFERLIREEIINDEFTIVAYARAKLKGLL